MTSERTRTEIWQGLWDAMRMSRYYLAIQQRHQTVDRVVVALLLVSGTGSVATLWSMMPDWSQAAFGMLIAVVTIWSALGRYSAKAAVAQSICLQCNDLAVEWRTLLAEVDGHRLDDAGAREALDRLDQKMNHVTARSGDVGLSTNDKINKRSAEEAGQELELSYAQ